MQWGWRYRAGLREIRWALNLMPVPGKCNSHSTTKLAVAFLDAEFGNAGSAFTSGKKGFLFLEVVSTTLKISRRDLALAVHCLSCQGSRLEYIRRQRYRMSKKPESVICTPLAMVEIGSSCQLDRLFYFLCEDHRGGWYISDAIDRRAKTWWMRNRSESGLRSQHSCIYPWLKGAQTFQKMK